MKIVSNKNNVEVKSFGEKGNGLIAKRPFIKDAIVATYVGEFFSDLKSELESLTGDDTHRMNYSIRFGDGYVMPTLDQLKKPGAHLANHSCNPNCRFNGNNELVAKRHIKKGEEITVYYGWSGIGGNICLCGEEHCTGLIGLKQEVKYSEPDEDGNARGISCELDEKHLIKTIFTAGIHGWQNELGQVLKDRIINYPELNKLIIKALVGVAALVRFEALSIGEELDIRSFNLISESDIDHFNENVDYVHNHFKMIGICKAA